MVKMTNFIAFKQHTANRHMNTYQEIAEIWLDMDQRIKQLSAPHKVAANLTDIQSLSLSHHTLTRYRDADNREANFQQQMETLEMWADHKRAKYGKEAAAPYVTAAQELTSWHFDGCAPSAPAAPAPRLRLIAGSPTNG